MFRASRSSNLVIPVTKSGRSGIGLFYGPGKLDYPFTGGGFSVPYKQVGP